MDLEQNQQRLNQVLTDILGSGNVYFQPSASVQMKYPAIVYERDDVETQYADDLSYLSFVRYEVSVIAQDPSHPAVGKMLALPKCKYSRGFATEDLNHDLFTLYF